MQRQMLLEKQMLDLKGNHLCLIYDKDPIEQMPALVPFIKQGLENNEQVIYVADDISLEQLSVILKMRRIDVEAEIDRGALKMWTRKEWRQPGELDSQKKSAQVRGFRDDAVKSGFKAIRFAVEMTWTLSPDIAAQELEEWESTLNTIFRPDFPGKIICQYNRHKLPPSVINQCFRTHPFVILENCLCHNFFYEDPLILGDKSESSRLEWMIAQLKASNPETTEPKTKDESQDPPDLLSENRENRIIQTLGRKYAMFLLGLMRGNGSMRFSEIKDKLGGISSSTLSQRLDELENVGLIKREVYPEVPPRVVYSLSKNGVKLLKTLVPLL